MRTAKQILAAILAGVVLAACLAIADRYLPDATHFVQRLK